MRRIFTYAVGLILWLPGKLNAQHVIYAEPVRSRSSVRVQVIGKTENYYWVAKLQKPRSYNRRNKTEIPDNLSFVLYDSRLNLLKEISSVIIPGSAKQWMMAGKKGLDHVVISSSDSQNNLICTRYQTGENSEPQTRLMDDLPAYLQPTSFIFVRSEDQSKNLLIAFENTGLDYTRLHVLLFDSDWNPVYHHVIAKNFFSQPCIQDDEIGFPSESFDNLPIKLANNGEWIMAFPSQTSRNFAVFHACANGVDFNLREIPLSPYYKREDISMSINNEKREMSLGLLSAYARTTFKNVQIVNYSMDQGCISFDTSYRFNTQALDIRNKNLSHESFINVPGKGFMFLKEYGAPYEFRMPAIPQLNEFETAYLLTSYSGMKQEKENNNPGYKMNSGLAPIPVVRNRGDLNLFYFPAVSKDSVWSGIMDMEQHADSNNPDLSYLLMPSDDKLYLIYNSAEGSSDPLATTTTLNMRGQPTEEGLVFWRMNKMMNFQLSRRFSATEIAVPFINNQQRGFAIIRL